MGDIGHQAVPVTYTSHKGHDCLVPMADQVQGLNPKRLEVEVEVGTGWVLGGRGPRGGASLPGFHGLLLILSSV